MNGKSLKSKVQSLKSKVSRRNAATGFTLIELLVSMGILMIIVLMLANLFQQSTRAYDIGLRQTDIGLEARAMMNLIQRELNMAIWDDEERAFFVLDRDGARNYNFLPPGVAVDFRPVGSLENLEEISVTVTDTRSVGFGVRVYVDGRGHDSDIRLTDVIDTHRSRDP